MADFSADSPLMEFRVERREYGKEFGNLPSIMKEFAISKKRVDRGYIVKIHLPGLKEKDIDIRKGLTGSGTSIGISIEARRRIVNNVPFHMVTGSPCEPNPVTVNLLDGQIFLPIEKSKPYALLSEYRKDILTLYLYN